MIKYIAVRLLQAVPVLFGITLLAFALVRLSPNDPVAMLVDVNSASQEQIAEVRRSYGFDDPVPVQYMRMVQGIFTGELRSIRTKEPAITVVLRALPTTAVLAVWSLLLGMAIGSALGAVSALRPYSKLDNVLSVFGLVGISMPSFLFALGLIVIFSENLGWLPAGGVRPIGSSDDNPFEGVRHWVLPVTVTGLAVAAVYARYARTGMLETLHQDYVRTARGKGLHERQVIVHHALRNSLISLVSLTGIYVPILMSGSIVIENVFALPGVGRVAVTSALLADYPVVIVSAMVATATVLLANLTTDVLYPIVDPRIRMS